MACSFRVLDRLLGSSAIFSAFLLLVSFATIRGAWKELCRLKVKDLHTRQGVMHFRAQRKRHKVQLIPLYPAARRLIEEFSSISGLLGRRSNRVAPLRWSYFLIGSLNKFQLEGSCPWDGLRQNREFRSLMSDTEKATREVQGNPREP
jgi:integrase